LALVVGRRSLVVEICAVVDEERRRMPPYGAGWI